MFNINPDHIIIGIAAIGFAAMLYLLYQTGRILDDEFFEDE